MPFMIMLLRFLSMAMNGRDLLSAQRRQYSLICVLQDKLLFEYLYVCCMRTVCVCVCFRMDGTVERCLKCLSVCAQQTYELLPGGGIVALQTHQPFPRLWLFELHSLAGSIPFPHALQSTAGERLQVSRIPGRTSPKTVQW